MDLTVGRILKSELGNPEINNHNRKAKKGPEIRLQALSSYFQILIIWVSFLVDKEKRVSTLPMLGTVDNLLSTN